MVDWLMAREAWPLVGRDRRRAMANAFAKDTLLLYRLADASQAGKPKRPSRPPSARSKFPTRT